ncbi:MAG: hypothetical protein A4E36_01726 [Methanoregulaceae archaeon PtaB.Bin009]|nr:MAG: hypothetical protein A4E36_01726 [Methanoregulaceae archaeon PtaB.Bin009]
MTKTCVPSGRNREINSVWSSTTFRYCCSLSARVSSTMIRSIAAPICVAIVARATRLFPGISISLCEVTFRQEILFPPEVIGITAMDRIPSFSASGV